MTPSTFEDRLLDELRAVVAARPAPEPEPLAPPRARRAPLGRVALAGAAVAATAAGVFVAAGGDPATAAYAVDPRSDGSVTVEIKSLRDAAGLQQQLRAAGINAVVDYTPFGKTCREPRGTPAAAGGRHSMGMRTGDGGATTFTIPRGGVGAGQTLVITASTGASASSVGTSIVQGAVAPCELVDAPALPAPGAGGADDGPSFSTGGAGAGATSIGPSTHTGP
jgi:hypothetical protein